MSATQEISLKVDELERLVKSVQPAAFLVPPRLLRRVIKRHRKVGGIGLLVPHSKGHVIQRDALLRYAAPAELGVGTDAELPNQLYLMVRPEADRLSRYSREEALVKHWQILFHLAIDAVMQEKLADGSLTPSLVRQRVKRLGLTEFAEITSVLRQENYLLPPEAAETIYAEFVAVYLTMQRFAPTRLPHFFPALRDLAAVDALIAEDIDADAIYTATRLPGAPEPTVLPPRITQVDGPPSLQISESGTWVEPAPQDRDSSNLLDRLKNALDLSDAEAQAWREALIPLRVQAARNFWSQDALLLHNLRSACNDSEHGIFTVDLVEWAMSLGELPIKRQLPGHQEVAIVRHLRSALDRMRFVRVTDHERHRLTRLIENALNSRERLMRDRFRPLIVFALDEVGLKPGNVVEGIGRAKMIEELLDHVVEFGNLNIGDLRDAISRNQMKLPDLTGPVELVRGDPLIRLNRRLAVSLDGIYRRGEFYMRLLHRLSSLAFGNWIGRLLVLWLILPFGLAAFVMITPSIAVEEGEKLLQLVGLMAKPAAPPERLVEWDEWDNEWEEVQAVRLAAEHQFPIPNPAGVLILGFFFLALLHVGSFRRLFFTGLIMLGRAMHAGFWLVYMPMMRVFLEYRSWRKFRRYAVWPMLMAFTGGLIVWWFDLASVSIGVVAASCFVLTLVILNTNLGRDVEETLTDWLLCLWVWLTLELAPGLLRLIMDISRWCLQAVEQLLYAVNELLRFRSGDNRIGIAIKAVVGLIWFCVTYVIRFAINLLIEPQINPIKHFPVVTVSHKICLPMIPTLADILKTMNVETPTVTATGIIFGIPGIFGFMVWELKENWKLYASNRSANLNPVLIGSHGETMMRLLHPGFHSGTIPKLYQRLRRAERHGQQRTIRKITAALHHVAESIAHFVEREMLALLRQSKGWGGVPIELGRIRLATNRVLVELRCQSLGESPMEFSFDHVNGWLLAGVLDAGWMPRLNADQQRTLEMAQAGLYKLAGVHLTREQISASLPNTIFAFEITDDGLAVWANADGAGDVVYDLSAESELTPIPLHGETPTQMPAIEPARLVFSNVPLTWDAWVKTWQVDHDR